MQLAALMFGFLVVLIGLLPYEIRAVKAIYRPVVVLTFIIYTSWADDLKKAWRS